MTRSVFENLTGRGLSSGGRAGRRVVTSLLLARDRALDSGQHPSRSARDSTRPPRMTASIRRVCAMFSSGFAPSRTRSARLPTSMDPYVGSTIEELGGPEGRRRQRLRRRESRLHQLAELVVDGGARKHERIAGIGTQHDIHAGGMGAPRDRQPLLVEAAHDPAALRGGVERNHAIGVVVPCRPCRFRDVPRSRVIPEGGVVGKRHPFVWSRASGRTMSGGARTCGTSSSHTASSCWSTMARMTSIGGFCERAVRRNSAEPGKQSNRKSRACSRLCRPRLDASLAVIRIGICPPTAICSLSRFVHEPGERLGRQAEVDLDEIRATRFAAPNDAANPVLGDRGIERWIHDDAAQREKARADEFASVDLTPPRLHLAECRPHSPAADRRSPTPCHERR